MHYNIAVLVPSTGMAHIGFTRCLVALFVKVSGQRLPGAKSQKMQLVTSVGSMLSTQREMLLKQGLESGATHLLWLDSDMKFPSDLVHRLMGWDRDYVAAQGVTKKVPAQPTAQTLEGKLCYSDLGKKGLEEVRHTGLAVALIKREAVEGLAPPNFMFPWNEKLQSYSPGEDAYFCGKLRERGVRLWLDHGLSREIGHIGVLTYGHELVGEVVREEIAVGGAS